MIDFSAALQRILVRVPGFSVTTERTVPLFVVAEGSSTARETLLARLRLSGVPSTRDAQEIIDDAIDQVRLQFLRRLGWSRVEELLDLPYSSQANETNWLRQLAALTEVKAVRRRLLRDLPTIFADASGGALNTWNEEALVRETDHDLVEKLIEEINDEIEDNMQLLAGEESPGDESDIEVSVPSPTDPPVLRESIWPGLRQ